MVTDGHPLERIGELLKVAVGPLELSVKTVLHDAVERVVAALRYGLHMCSIPKEHRRKHTQKIHKYLY